MRASWKPFLVMTSLMFVVSGCASSKDWWRFGANEESGFENLEDEDAEKTEVADKETDEKDDSRPELPSSTVAAAGDKRTVPGGLANAPPIGTVGRKGDRYPEGPMDNPRDSLTMQAGGVNSNRDTGTRQAYGETNPYTATNASRNADYQTPSNDTANRYGSSSQNPYGDPARSASNPYATNDYNAPPRTADTRSYETGNSYPSNPYAQPTTNSNPYAAPSSNPYAQPTTTNSNPYAAPSSNPYAQPTTNSNPYATPSSNPYSQPSANTNPYATPSANPYSQSAPPSNPYAAPTSTSNPYDTYRPGAPTSNAPYSSTSPPATGGENAYRPGSMKDVETTNWNTPAPASNPYTGGYNAAPASTSTPPTSNPYGNTSNYPPTGYQSTNPYGAPPAAGNSYAPTSTPDYRTSNYPPSQPYESTGSNTAPASGSAYGNPYGPATYNGSTIIR